MSDFIMRGIPSHLVTSMWHYADPYVKRALDHTCGELRSGDIKALCEQKLVQLWLITSSNRAVGAITTEIVNYPNRKHCRVITLGGSGLSDWIELCDNTLVGWASEQGCQALEAYVRKGMVPKLADLSWRHKHSIVVKELSNV